MNRSFAIEDSFFTLDFLNRFASLFSSLANDAIEEEFNRGTHKIKRTKKTGSRKGRNEREGICDKC